MPTHCDNLTASPIPKDYYPFPYDKGFFQIQCRVYAFLWVVTISPRHTLRLFPTQLLFRSEFHPSKDQSIIESVSRMSASSGIRTLAVSAAGAYPTPKLHAPLPCSWQRTSERIREAPASWLALAKFALVDG